MDASRSGRQRGARRGLADARLLLGIALVLVSVAGVWFVVAAARDTEPVLVATRTIVAGEEIAPGDLDVAHVALGAVGEHYEASGPAEGAVATRTLARGELVPAGSIATDRDAASTRIVLRSSTPLAASIEPGSRVEVWAAAPLEQGAFAPAEILVAEATVARIDAGGGMVTDGSTHVEIVLARADVAPALDAVAARAAISVVPLAGPAGGPGAPGDAADTGDAGDAADTGEEGSR